MKKEDRGLRKKREHSGEKTDDSTGRQKESNHPPELKASRKNIEKTAERKKRQHLEVTKKAKQTRKTADRNRKEGEEERQARTKKHRREEQE